MFGRLYVETKNAQQASRGGRKITVQISTRHSFEIIPSRLYGLGGDEGGADDVMEGAGHSGCKAANPIRKAAC
jgi:hypothetical protein